MNEIKVKDKVIFNNEAMHKIYPKWYPSVGTNGVVTSFSDGTPKVQWESGSTSGKDRWYCDKDYLILSAE
jgi:hypothetical protein